MVVKKRSSSSSYIPTFKSDLLPYSAEKLNRASSTGSIATGRHWSLSPATIGFKKSTIRNEAKIRKLLSVLPNVMEILLLAALCCAIYFSHTTLSIRDSELVIIRHEFGKMEDTLLKTETKISTAHTSIIKFQHQITDLLPGWSNIEKEFNDETIFQQIAYRQNAMKERTHGLQDTIANLHRGEAIEHFGLQQYRLKFQIRNNDGKPLFFIVEMAPLDMMPHSVNYFMEMVAARVWDDTTFTYNSNHIILAEFKDGAGNDKTEAFIKEGISTLTFQEYNHDYPHNKYTLGFGGRPGGPGFYINTKDNSVLHGPGGQEGYNLDEEADPCFAKVIEGREVIDWMQSTTDAFSVIESVRRIHD